jgi:Na+/melibiose symporter-like transporter
MSKLLEQHCYMVLVLNWNKLQFSFFFFTHTYNNRTASSCLLFSVCPAAVGLVFLLLPLFCCFGQQYLFILRSIMGQFAACPLVPWLRAMAVPLRLYMAEMPLGLAADWALLANRDSLAMGVAAIRAAVQSQ